MKREILFRGKIKYNGNHLFAGDWAIGSLVLKLNAVFIYVIEEDELGNITRKYEVEVIPETIGQFTGLTDKNGVKIFEGDIFKLGVEKEVFEVRFEHGCFMAFCNGKQYGLIGELQMCFINIIGNIHDNKELIK